MLRKLLAKLLPGAEPSGTQQRSTPALRYDEEDEATIAEEIDGLRLGDSVRINDGQFDEDSGIDIGGWQGRIVEIDPDADLILVEWDSVTLRNMPEEFLIGSEEQGLNWAQYYIAPADVTPVPPRDSEADAEAAIDELQNDYAWYGMGPEGEEIQQVLAGIDLDDERAQMQRWEEHLKETLTFPFQAEVSEWQERGPLQAGDRLVVRRITDVDPDYGVIVEVRHQGKTFEFPLCDLRAADTRSANYDPVAVYSFWYTNR